MLSEPIFRKRNPLMMGKLPPERIINRNVLAFFLPSSTLDVKGYSLEIRHIAEILKIPIYEDFEQVTEMRSQVRHKGFFVPVWNVNEFSLKTAHYLVQCGYQVVIGVISRENPKNKESHTHNFNVENVVVVPADWFLGTLLWDEFGLSYRAIRIHLITSHFIKNVLIPYLRKLRLGEPQLRVYFEELAQQKALGIFALKDKIIREFAIELDFEPTQTSVPRLVFCQEQQRSTNVLDRLIYTIDTHYKATEVYICVQITPDYDLCCHFGITEGQEPIIEFGVVWRRGKYEFKPFYEMRKDQWDEQHTKDGLQVALERIGELASLYGMSPLPEHLAQTLDIEIIRQHIEKQDENV